MVLIGLDSGKEQIRLNQRILHQQAVAATLAGLLVWSIAPFCSKHPAWRYGSLTFSFGCGVITVLTGLKLEKGKLLFNALQKAEEDDYLHRIASSQFAQQQQWEMLAQTSMPLTELTPPEAMEVPTTSTSEASLPLTELTETTTKEVEEAVREGKSDTHIIEKVLGMPGRRFAEGKEILQRLKEGKK